MKAAAVLALKRAVVNGCFAQLYIEANRFLFWYVANANLVATPKARVICGLWCSVWHLPAVLFGSLWKIDLLGRLVQRSFTKQWYLIRPAELGQRLGKFERGRRDSYPRSWDDHWISCRARVWLLKFCSQTAVCSHHNLWYTRLLHTCPSLIKSGDSGRGAPFPD